MSPFWSWEGQRGGASAGAWVLHQALVEGEPEGQAWLQDESTPTMTLVRLWRQSL